MIINKGNVDIHPFFEHESNDPILNTFAETGAVSKFWVSCHMIFEEA